MRSAMDQREPRILLVKLSSIGDCIYTLPLVHALRRHFPEAFISWVIDARACEIAQGQGDVDEVIVVNTRQWRRQLASGRWAGLFAAIKETVRRLRRHRFDIAIDAQGLIKSGVLARLSGAPVRVGFEASDCRERLNVLFTNRRVRPSDVWKKEGPVHILEKNLSLLARLGIDPEGQEREGTDLRFTVQPEDEKVVEDFLAGHPAALGGPLVGVHPGAGHPVKLWDMERFGALSDSLAERLRATVVLFGGPDSDALIESVRARMRSPALVLPRVTLGQLAAFLRRCRVVLSADSGPLHLAAAVGCATVGLFGPSDPDLCAPRGPRNVAIKKPCTCEGPQGHFFNRNCRERTCMKRVEVQEVFQAVAGLI